MKTVFVWLGIVVGFVVVAQVLVGDINESDDDTVAVWAVSGE